jgi:hypothetical protein
VWRHSTLIIPSPTARRQSIDASVHNLAHSQGTRSHTVRQKIVWTECPRLPFLIESQNTHYFAFSPWTAGNPCSPRADGSPYIRHTPTDMLQLGSYLPNYSRCYCEKHVHKLLILDRTESFVADESCFFFSNPIIARMLYSSYPSLNKVCPLPSLNKTWAEVSQSV